MNKMHSKVMAIILLTICMFSFGYFGIREDSPYPYVFSTYLCYVTIVSFVWLMSMGPNSELNKEPLVVVGVEIIWWIIGISVFQNIVISDRDRYLGRAWVSIWIFIGFVPFVILKYFQFKRELKEAEEEDRRNGVI